MKVDLSVHLTVSQLPPGPSNCPPVPCDHSLHSPLTMSSLLTVCLTVLLTASLGLWVPWPGEARLGTKLELRPLKIQTQGGLLGLTEHQSLPGILDSLHQAVTSFIDSVIYLVSSQFRQENIYDFSSSPSPLSSLLPPHLIKPTQTT